MARQVIPDSGNWSAIASLINANDSELYSAPIARREVLRASDTTDQVPGLVGPVDVKFGSVAVGTPSDPVSMDANNIFTFNQAGNYHLRLSTQASRTASSGTAEVYLAVFLDPGVGSFVQAGQSVKFVVPNSNTNIPYQAELTADVLAPGWRFKVMLQVAGQSDAGLFGENSVPNGWNPAFSTDALVSQYFLEVTP